MLVYIHVPFCLSKCKYCAFYSQPIDRDIASGQASGLMQHYVDTLLLELARYGDEYQGEPVRSVFFGGGTPSLLPPKAIGAIMDRLHRHFKLAPRAEITLEANPESLRGRNPLPEYLACGINRLSIGIQSLDDATLRMLGRRHKGADSMRAIFAAREAGFANIGVDLMWGLPGQSMRQWLQTLKDVIRLGPDHISSYGLTLEPGTPLERECESGALVLPPERDQSIMFMEGAAFLEANGFLHYEISNFARMGFQCRHNLGYWEGSDYLGLGPSATSTIKSRRWTNPATLKGWDEAARKGLKDRDTEILTPKTRILELIMLRLRTARGLRLKAYHDLTGSDFIHDHQKLVQAMHENGLIRIRNGYLSLTRSGMLVSNTIIANIFERVSETLAQNPARVARTREKPAIETAPQAVQAIPVIWPEATPEAKAPKWGVKTPLDLQGNVD